VNSAVFIVKNLPRFLENIQTKTKKLIVPQTKQVETCRN